MILVWILSACDGGSGDPRTSEGLMTYAATRIAAQDGAGLYRVIDERSRHAMISIVADRRASAELIRQEYPPEAQAEALANLGPAAEVADAASFFASECRPSCMNEIGSRLGSPLRTEAHEDGTVTVETARGTIIELYRREPTHWYGIVWQLAEFDRRRNAASRDHALISENAQVYRRRREFQ